MQHFYTVLLLLFFGLGAFAQNQPYTLISSDRLPEGERRVTPDVLQGWEVDVDAFKAILWSAPHEQDVSPGKSPVILTLPDPAGVPSRFQIVAYDMMEPALAAAFPDNRTWRGLAVDNPRLRIRLDWTARGFHASVRGAGADWFVDPYLWNDSQYYQSYFTKDYPQPLEAWSCTTEADFKEEEVNENDLQEKAGDCNFRTYRLAVAATAEYCAFHGADDSSDEALVLAAITTSVGRVNQVYEADLAFRTVLIANSNLIWYYDAATDPFSNGNGSAMLGQNQTNTDAVIGFNNYDIGHVFSTGGGGVANLRVPCTGSKARGVTGLNSPVGDPFDIDYVAHEMGHQFGGNHTQNNSCNRAANAAREPGSASTIMGYAGICAPNVQNNSDAYYHGYSIQEMANYMQTGTGATCAVVIDGSNSAPSVTPQPDRTIPVSTPFVLTASATDANPLTYNWEQWDNEVGEVMPPESTNTQGPMFRSFFATPSPERYFPRLPDLVTGFDFDWEELPGVGRNMEFRVTVRDYTGTFGCTSEDNVNVTVAGSAGPFVVNQPNTGLSWQVGTSRQVLWDVANTNQSPVSCARVDILLSTDGGFTYPVVLASNVTNNGSATIIVPNQLTTSARVMVRCSNNIFFDISDVDFNITNAPAPDFFLSANPPSVTICEGFEDPVLYQVRVEPVAGFSDPVTLTVVSSPPGTVGAFSPMTISPGGFATLSLLGVDALPAGTYDIAVQGNGSAGTRTLVVELIVEPAVVPPILIAPADDAEDVPSLVLFEWGEVPAAQLYELEIATDPGFFDVISRQTLPFEEYGENLDTNAVYFWRVRSLGDCGFGPWSAIRNFMTAHCYTYESTDTPIAIDAFRPDSIVSELLILDEGSVVDLDITQLTLNHTATGELRIRLYSPDGDTTVLIDNLCGSDNNVALRFDDEAFQVNPNCPLTGNQQVQPATPLSNMDGSNLDGSWLLEVVDDNGGNGGSLQDWSMYICIAQFEAVFPVSWLAFDARAHNQTSLLDWRTEQEVDNAGFEIQRRSATDRDFVTIGWIDGLNRSGENNYTFTDTDVRAGQTYFYRLHQIDFDGRDDYSPIRTVRFAASDRPDIYLYPNPVTDQLRYSVFYEGGTIAYELFDGLGQRIGQQNLSDVQGQIDLSALPAGVYLIRFQAGAWQEVRRVVKE